MKFSTTMFASPLVCLGLLGGIVAERASQRTAADAEPYHARAAAAIGKMPYIVGRWTGKDTPVPQAAVRLLRSNQILSRRYEDVLNADPMHWRRTVDVLIVQCRDSRDMTGHYPPICYPGAGQELVHREARGPMEVAPGVKVPFMEYHFQYDDRGHSVRNCVYNFFVIPGHGLRRDIQDVRDAAEDYLRRFYGAAQFQVLMSADLPRHERDEIFRTLIGNNPGVFAALTDVDGRAAADKNADKDSRVAVK